MGNQNVALTFSWRFFTGYIRPTFAPRPNRRNPNPQPTIHGPHPVVSFTEQPISELLNTLPEVGLRYEGYGIAFFKPYAYNDGARPVVYGTQTDLSLLPEHLKYLWARYELLEPGMGGYPVDFTWEREWRRMYPKPCEETNPKGLEIVSWRDFHLPIKTSIIVQQDNDIPVVRACLNSLANAEQAWAAKLQRIVSLETARRELEKGDARYAKIETWPSD
jgi:hypothetical protein